VKRENWTTNISKGKKVEAFSSRRKQKSKQRTKTTKSKHKVSYPTRIVQNETIIIKIKSK